MSNVRDWVVKGPRRLPPINFWFTAPCVTVWGLVRGTTVVSQADSVEDVRPAGSYQGPWGHGKEQHIFSSPIEKSWMGWDFKFCVLPSGPFQLQVQHVHWPIIAHSKVELYSLGWE